VLAGQLEAWARGYQEVFETEARLEAEAKAKVAAEAKKQAEAAKKTGF